MKSYLYIFAATVLALFLIETKSNAGGASFDTDHSSLYPIGSKYDYVNGWAEPLAEKVRSGMSDEAIFRQFKNRIESSLEDLFSWDIIGGRYYRVSRYSEWYMYSIDGKEGQGNYQIGVSNDNWAGYHDNASLNLRYMSETQSYEKLDHNEFQKAKDDRDDVCSSDFERELRLVPSVMTASASGELKKKGDQVTVRVRLAAKTTGETEEMKVFHSCVGFTSGYEDTTPDGTYDRLIKIPHDDPRLGENPPMAGQTLRLKVSDSSALKLSADEVETSPEGEAVVIVTALKDNASGEVIATYDYSGVAESDHSEASVHVGESDGTWYVSGKISDVRGKSMFGISTRIDIEFEFSFNLDEVENFAIEGKSTEGSPAEFRFIPSNIQISRKGSSRNGTVMEQYSISDVTPRPLENVKGYVTRYTDGVCFALAYDTAANNSPVIATYNVHCDCFCRVGPAKVKTSDDYTDKWDAPFQFSFPLKEGRYIPLCMSRAVIETNEETVRNDKENFYIGLGSASLAETSWAPTSTLTGEVIVSRIRPE